MSETVGAELKFPCTVKQFFAHANAVLRRGDIVLSRSPTFASTMIRLFSGSPFSHAAIVFLLPRPKEHLEHTFVIESLFKGVGVGNLESYVSGKTPISEVGILRFRNPPSDTEFFNRANGILLNEVNKPYDFRRLWRMALDTIFRRAPGAVNAAAHRPSIYRRWLPRQFICSGFIQYGFYRSAVAGGTDPQSVILKNGLEHPSPDEMLGTTPEDVAKSDKLEWLYIIRHGWVHKVKDFDSARNAFRR